MALLSPFTPETPDAYVVPADDSNCIWSRTNEPKVSVLHTPEEPADDNEVTPAYFQTPGIFAATHAYADNDGDLYEMVPWWIGCYANGVTRATKSYPADTDPSYSLNYQSRSIEIEGRAATIHQTCPRGSDQWNTVVRWVLTGHLNYGIPLDRAHVIGHYEVASDRSDPGQLDIEAIIEDAIALLGEEEEMSTEEIKQLIDQAIDIQIRQPLERGEFVWQRNVNEKLHQHAVPDAPERVHVVVSGDTLGSIAKQYGTDVRTLQVRNAIDNANTIRVGQKVVIP